MAVEPITGVPGVKASRTATDRAILRSENGKLLYPSGLLIDGSASGDAGNTGDTDILRAGNVMGKITASGKFAPSIIGLTTADASASATAIFITAAQAVELNRRVGSTGDIQVIGPPTDTGTVVVEAHTLSAINTSTGELTIDALTAAMAEGSIVAAADGSGDPVCLLGDGTGIKVTDRDETRIDVQFPNALVGGIVDSSQIIGWSTMATSVKTYVEDQLNQHCQFVFDSRF